METTDRVASDELERLRAEPERAIQDEYIVCLECGAIKFEPLWRHLRDAHRITVETYRLIPVPGGSGPRYNPRTALQPKNTSRKQRESAQTAERREQISAARKSVRPGNGRRGGWKLSAGFRRTRSRQALGRPLPGRQSVSDADLAMQRLQGKTGAEIAKALNRNRGGVQRRLVRMGSTTEASLSEHGVPITGKWVNELCADFGLNKRQLAKACGVALPTLIGASSPKDQDRTLSVVMAKKLLGWKQQATKEFCFSQYGRWPVREFLRSEIEVVRELHGELTAGMAGLREWQRSDEHGAGAKDMLDWLCEHAREEKAAQDRSEIPGKKFRTLLNLWPNIEKLFSTKAASALKRARPNELAAELLAKSYEVAPHRIRQVLDGQVQPRDPQSMRALVLARPSGSSRGKGGRRKLPADQRQYAKIALTVEQELPRMQRGMQLAAKLKRDDPVGMTAWKSKLIEASFSPQEADAILASKTTMGATERCIAIILRVKLRTVQTACSRFRHTKGSAQS